MSQEAYTGVHGVVTYAVATLAGARFDFEVTRGTVSFPRAGKWSDLNKPGKVSCTGSIKRIQSNADLLMAVLNGTPTTGETAAAHAGLTAPGANSENITDMTDTAPSSPSKVRLTCLTAAVTGAGEAVLIGTDAGDNPISEIIAIPKMEADAYVTSQNVFKTLTHVALKDVVAEGGTIGVQYRAGASTVVPGSPKLFTLVGKVQDGSNHITVTLSNVWFNKGKFGFEDADKGLEEDPTFVVTDPDRDIQVTGVDA